MDKESEKACCKICLLAANMKDCKACKFAWALQEKDSTLSTQGKEETK